MNKHLGSKFQDYVKESTPEPDGNIHIIPKDDSIDHFETRDCPCGPVLDYKDMMNKSEVWVHKRIGDGEGVQ